MSTPGWPGDQTADELRWDAVVARALRRATNVTTDAWAIFVAVRDTGGLLVDLRILYGNEPFWAMTGLTAAAAVGRGLAEVAPELDWSQGLAARLFGVMQHGGTDLHAG